MDERSDIYRKRNRNRAIAGVAIAAATSFGGYAASEWLSDHVDLTKPFRWAGSKMSEKVSDLRHNGLRNQFDDDASDASQTQGWSDIQVPSGDAQAPSIDAGGNGIGSDSAKNALHDYVDAHQKDFTITKGEGMFHQMDEMGIPEGIQRKVMEDVGPKWDGKWTYAAGDNCGWSHTGTMPDRLVKDIFGAAKDHGYDALKVIEHAHEKPHLIKRGDGVISLVNREYGVPLSPSQAHELANELQGNGLKMMYDSSYLKQHFEVEDGILLNHGAIADADNHFIINYLKDHHLIEDVPSSTMTEATNTTAPIDNLPNPHDLFGITAAKQDNASLTELQTTYRDFVTDLKAGQYAKLTPMISYKQS